MTPSLGFVKQNPKNGTKSCMQSNIMKIELAYKRVNTRSRSQRKMRFSKKMHEILETLQQVFYLHI